MNDIINTTKILKKWGTSNCIIISPDEREILDIKEGDTLYLLISKIPIHQTTYQIKTLKEKKTSENKELEEPDDSFNTSPQPNSQEGMY